MISPINGVEFNQNFNIQKSQNEGTVSPEAPQNTLELSGYTAGRAILARNNISFKNLAEPVEVTSKYNKPIQGKDHLDLPNIHVFEYPDTNLQVFIDENENMKDSSATEARLYINCPNNSGTRVEKELSKRILARILDKQITGSKLTDNTRGFYTIVSKTDINDKNYFKNLNNLITNPSFTEKDLEEEKQKLINEINETDYSKDITYLLMDKKDLNSKEECIKEINNITLDDIKKYYSGTLKNSEATYYITLNKNKFKDKSAFLKNLNDNISVKFLKKGSINEDNSYILNKNNTAIFVKDKNVDGIEFEYPYEEKDIRDNMIALFANLILIFLSEPYIDEKSDTKIEKLPINSKNLHQSLKCNNLKFNFNKPEFTNLTPERALNLQKEIVKMVNDTDYTVTLEDIKNTYKEIFKEDFCKNYQPEKNNSDMYQYGEDVFKLYEILDSIKTQDVKEYINKYIINQEPVVKIGDDYKVNKEGNQNPHD